MAAPLQSPGDAHVLVVRARGRSCAVPLPHVVETMRPLPAVPLAGAPAFVRGVSVVRGRPVTVVDLPALLFGPGGGEPSRFVTLRVADRQVALAVDDVVGVRTLPASASLPPLLADGGEAAEAVGRLDAALLAVLSSARLPPEDPSR